MGLSKAMSEAASDDIESKDGATKSEALDIDSDDSNKKNESVKRENEEKEGDEENEESALSTLEDDSIPQKKRKTKTKALPKKPKKAKTAAAKDPEEERITTLKSYVVKCGVRKVWKNILTGLSTNQQIKKLKEILKELGVEGQPSVEKCKAVAMRRELENEVEGLDTSNILSEGRPTRSRRAKVNYSVFDASESEASEVEVENTQFKKLPSGEIKIEEPKEASETEESSEDEYVASSEEEVSRKRKSRSKAIKVSISSDNESDDPEDGTNKKSKKTISDSEPASDNEKLPEQTINSSEPTSDKEKSPETNHSKSISSKDLSKEGQQDQTMVTDTQKISNIEKLPELEHSEIVSSNVCITDEPQNGKVAPEIQSPPEPEPDSNSTLKPIVMKTEESESVLPEKDLSLSTTNYIDTPNSA